VDCAKGKTVIDPGFTINENAQEVAHAFDNFLDLYYDFKAIYDLPHTVDDIRDIGLGIAKKQGILIRHVQHIGRDDPKPDYREDVPRQVMGTIAYLIMLLIRLDLPMAQGMKKELIEAVDQHAEGQ
jgi:hypothetical protein